MAVDDAAVKIRDSRKRIEHADINGENVVTFGVDIKIRRTAAAARWSLAAFVNEVVLDQAVDDRRNRAGAQSRVFGDIGARYRLPFADQMQQYRLIYVTNIVNGYDPKTITPILFHIGTRS